MREQNLQLARAIARSYQVDETHIAQVERFAVQLCRHLVDFGINERMVFVLRTAIILSEVGKFVSLRNHSEHAYRIIMGTDLFGLSDREKRSGSQCGILSLQGQNPMMMMKTSVI